MSPALRLTENPGHAGKRPIGKQRAVSRELEIRPEQVIPLGEDEMGRF